MKRFVLPLIIAATLLAWGQMSFADGDCLSHCDDNYDKCIAGTINLPEPRTYEEQEKLQSCYDTRGECQHSCEDGNEPGGTQQKQEEAN